MIRCIAAAIGAVSMLLGTACHSTGSVREDGTIADTSVFVTKSASAADGAHPFNELYADDQVWVAIKSEYVDFDRQYTAEDFPEVDIAKIVVDNYEITYHQIVAVYLKETGEKAVRSRAIVG